MRGFEKISFEQFNRDFKGRPNIDQLYDELKLPSRENSRAAGYDFYAPFNIVLRPGGIMKIPTGIKAYMQGDEFMMLVNKSSVGLNYNVRLMNQVGIVDCYPYNRRDDEGQIWIALKNEGERLFKVNRGEAFVQGIFSKYLLVDGEKMKELKE